eukprot:6203131-Pleurochrysis_carterae.AAC.1
MAGPSAPIVQALAGLTYSRARTHELVRGMWGRGVRGRVREGVVRVGLRVWGAACKGCALCLSEQSGQHRPELEAEVGGDGVERVGGRRANLHRSHAAARA